MQERGTFRLTYESTEIGVARDAFCSDDTWHGTFEMTADPAAGAVEQRLTTFVKFCMEWNERARAEADGADPAEFDRFSTTIRSGCWRAIQPDGTALALAESPVFFRSGDVTWRVSSSV